jgi:hypothetical protein
MVLKCFISTHFGAVDDADLMFALWMSERGLTRSAPRTLSTSFGDCFPLCVTFVDGPKIVWIYF